MELPFKVRSEKKCKDKFWVGQESDYGEDCLPSSEGLLTEVIYAMRGTEMPTIFLLWAGISLILAFIKREAWIKWYPSPLYPNIFCCLVGNAGDKKGATMGVWYDILEKALESVKDDPFMAVAKDMKIVKDKTTPEALLDSLLPEPGDHPTRVGWREVRDKKGRLVVGEDGLNLVYETTSEALIFVDELNVLFSKATYSSTMSELFLALYDPHKKWGFKTKGAGQKYLKNLCTSMLGATTPTALRTSLPENMLGDGFLSRTTLVYLPMNKKSFCVPREVEGAPSFEELGMKLGFIGVVNVGEMQLTEDAFEEYDSWYKLFKEDQLDNPELAGIKSRMDKIVLKVAFAMKAQRYSTEPWIEKQDIQDAIRIITRTYGEVNGLVKTISRKEFLQEYQRLLNMFKEKEVWFRCDLLKKANVPAEMLSKILEHMRQEKKIVVYRNGQQMKMVSNSHSEMYKFRKRHEEENRYANDGKVMGEVEERQDEDPGDLGQIVGKRKKRKRDL